MFKTIVITAPIVEPVTLAEAKEQLRLTSLFTADDPYITGLISVARDRVEKYCNRFFTEQQVSIIFDEGESPLVLPYPDLQSVDQVSTIDSEGNETVVDSGDYTFNSITQSIYFTSGVSLTGGEVKVNVTTGAPVEYEGAKQAMLMILTDMYELRTESVVASSSSAVAENPAVKALAYPYRVELFI